MNEQNTGKRRLTIRVVGNTLSFSMADTPDAAQPIIYEPYAVNSGISMAANLREAFRTQRPHFMVDSAQVLVGTKVLMVPVEQFQEDEAATLYQHAFPKSEHSSVVYNVLPDLNAVAVFCINKDLRLVINDNFSNVKTMHLMTPVWRHLHQRSYTGHYNKLYAYFHDKQIDVFAFQQNRFKFCNSFDTNRTQDALYYLLYVWKQLAMQPESDELHIAGDVPDKEALQEGLRKYLQKAYFINPQAEFNQAPATQVKGMPFDLMTLYTKGR